MRQLTRKLLLGIAVAASLLFAVPATSMADRYVARGYVPRAYWGGYYRPYYREYWSPGYYYPDDSYPAYRAYPGYYYPAPAYGPGVVVGPGRVHVRVW